MVRLYDRISPVLLAACTGLALLYLLAVWQVSLVFLYVLGAVLFLSALSLTVFKKQSRALLVLYSLTAGVGLACISANSLNAQSRELSTGIDLKKIDGYTGYLLDDSTLLDGNKVFYRLCLQSVQAEKYGWQARAAGVVSVYTQLGRGSYQTMYKGRLLRVKGSLRPSAALDGLSGQGKLTALPGYQFWLWQLRARLLGDISAVIDTLPDESAALLKALFLGDRSALPIYLDTGFNRCGVQHLLALSGLHVGIIYALLALVLLTVRGQRLKWVLSALAVLFYLFLIGPRPSLFRASLMLILTGLGFVLDRDFRPLNILGMTAVVFLLVDPAAAFSLSFILSFAAMAGILLFGQRIDFFFKPYLWPWVRAPLALSLSAQLFTLPLILILTGTYYPIGIIASLLLIPLITVFLWMGIIYLLGFSLMPLAPLFHWGLQGLYSLLRLLLDWFAVFPPLSLGKNNFLFCGVLVLVGTGLVALPYLRRKRKLIIHEL